MKRRKKMDRFLWMEFGLCVVLPVFVAPFAYLVLHASLFACLYVLLLIPIFIDDYFKLVPLDHERKS